jgi:D-lyxose ketol-isomerase
MSIRRASVVVLSLITVLGIGCASGTARFGKLDNKSFYDASGKFDEKAAKQVYYDFLAAAGYSVTDAMKEKFYVSDFGLGRFTEAGLGCLVWWGDQKYNYSSLDAYLLPGQIIPEHWHVKVRDIPEKMEAWLVRYGEMYTYAEGEPTAAIKAKLSEADAAHITVKHEKVLGLGEIAGIDHPLEKHWMQAGPKGLIFSEFSTFHTGEAVKFTDGKIKF